MTNSHPAKRMHSRPIPMIHGNRGFAMVVTVSLMILLALLAVSLLGLSSIALRTSGAMMDQEIARANARLALQIALGELQKAAGPDQRVTARADVLSLLPNPTHSGKSKWTGVWDVSSLNTNPAATIPAPVWLVSGQSPSNTGPAPDSSNITAKNAVRLVGANTTDVGSSIALVGNEIIVPLQTVISKADATVPDGAYGWWVGDEGVKARINLSDPRFDLKDLQDRVASVAAPGVSMINKLTKFANLTLDSTLNTAMTKGLSNSEMCLISDKLLQSGLKSHFHDASVYSQGVLANVREGGLKRDLNRQLYDSSPAVSSTTQIFKDSDNMGPDWGIARSWAALKDKVTINTNATPSISDVFAHHESNNGLNYPVQHGVGPIMSRWGVETWWRAICVSGANGTPGSRYTANFGYRPVLQLTNPYNVRLPEKSYRVSFNRGDHGQCGGFHWKVGKRHIKYEWYKLLGLSNNDALLKGLPVNSSAAARPWFHFQTEPVALEPGETVVFTPGSSNWQDTLNVNDINLLKRGLNSEGVLAMKYLTDDASSVTWEELNSSDAKGIVQLTYPGTGSGWIGNFMIGECENNPANDPDGVWGWVGQVPSQSYGAGNTEVDVILALSKPGDAPNNLIRDLGETLAHLEQCGTSMFFRPVINQKNPGPDESFRNQFINWAQTGNLRGALIFTNDFVLGNDNNIAGNIPNWGNPWTRDRGLRFPFPCAKDGREMVNGSDGGGPGSGIRAAGGARCSGFMVNSYGNDKSTYMSPIKPMEIDPDSGSVYWGNGSSNMPGGGQARIVLFDLPTAEILSPGQLQHVNLGGRDRKLRDVSTRFRMATLDRGNGMENIYYQIDYPNRTMGLIGQAGCIQPTYILGNSYMDPAVAIADLANDWSYLANREIWDRWCCSGVTTNLTDDDLKLGRLSNPRMQVAPGAQPSELRDVDKVASKLLVQGMFNLNSTSVESWKTLLASTANSASIVATPGGNSITFDPATGRDPLTRYARTLITNQFVSGTTPILGKDPRWSGPLQVSANQLNDLAKGIVQRIKERCVIMKRPYASLSEFINRPADKQMGILQETFDQKANPANTPGGGSLVGGRLGYKSDKSKGFLGEMSYVTTPMWFAVTPALGDVVEPEGAPGALRQGDFLQSVGAFINVRSDTFRIRAYGEKRSGSGPNATVTAQAWCEAIVQRVPEYVDPSDLPEIVIPPGAASPLTPANQKFGRRFLIQSFRWLDPSEI